MLVACAFACAGAGAGAAEAASVDVVVPAPPPGQLLLVQARVVTPKPRLAPSRPLVVVVPSQGLMPVVGGALRPRRHGRTVAITAVLGGPLAATAIPTPGVRLRVSGVPRTSSVALATAALDLAGLARSTAGPSPRIGRLNRGMPIRQLAGPAFGDTPPLQVARLAFWMLYNPVGWTQRKMAAKLGLVLGVPAPPPPPPPRFKIDVPPVGPPVAPARCPGRPDFVALQSTFTAESQVLGGFAGLPGLLARGVPFMATGASSRPQMPAVVSGDALVTMTSSQMAQTLRRAIDAAANHLVIVDRIEGAPWSDGVPAEPPVIDPASKGVAFRAAMAAIDVPSPYGRSYADRVHVWIGPGLHSSIGAGLGPNHNLGRDGRPHRRTFNALLQGLSRSGGVWNQMFHGADGGTPGDPLSVEEWLRWPAGFADMYTRLGGRLATVHFLLTATPALPAGPLPDGAGTPMSAQWALAAQPGTNSTILCNGPGALNIDGQARDWLQAFDTAFPAT